MLIHLKAVNPERDIDRFYILQVTETLFKEKALIVHHGRNGSKGRMRIYYYEEEEDLLKKMNALLKRRINAKSRLGVNYEGINVP